MELKKTMNGFEVINRAVREEEIRWRVQLVNHHIHQYNWARIYSKRFYVARAFFENI